MTRHHKPDPEPQGCRFKLIAAAVTGAIAGATRFLAEWLREYLNTGN
ncbi:hypothetical protein [Virgisporangium aurantiacum]|uniref:Uncharacterized protein n=1 Tax=Virgisporangium aurantiacum TaxID=175570 RepID=A0A8J4E6K3_9ACTN|nr:hypothetical protein [Virgisporangium aurantiacum]GIJ64180.1 hypothetical protein Vau01_116960 [Virgisporangium aurantiacum]